MTNDNGRNCGTEELTTEQKLIALQEEYQPQIIELMRSIGITVSDDISDDDFAALLQDQDTFVAALPNGMTLDTLPAEFIEKLQQLLTELREKAMSIMFEDTLG